MDLRIKGDQALVVGASDGIGLATARVLAEEGCDVTIVSRDAAALALAAAGIGAAHIAADATDAASVAALVAAWGERRLDILVVAVGGSQRAPFEHLTDADWQTNWEFNILATVRLVRGFLPALRLASGARMAQGAPGARVGQGAPGARVVLFGAAAARMPYAEQIVSNVHKAGHLALTKTLSLELLADGIRVNAVLPGRTITRLWRKRAAALAAEEGISPDAVLERFARDIPAGRFGAAEEIADVAAFLASPRSGYVVGQSVAADGGIGRGLL